jgi:hypothetical protein
MEKSIRLYDESQTGMREIAETGKTLANYREQHEPDQRADKKLNACRRQDSID